MIRNLNQITFRDFGSVLPGNAQNGSPLDKKTAAVLTLPKEQISIFFTKTDTYLGPRTGSVVLSLSRDGENYAYFYLDKPVCIRPGIWYTLAPFLVEAQVLLAAGEAPEARGVCKPEDLRLRPSMRVDAIYTFFYQEREQGFLFPGLALPIAELTYVDQGSIHSVIEGKELILSQGDLVIYGPGQWHMQYADIDVAPRYVTLTFSVTGDIQPLLNRKFAAPQKVVTLLQEMLREQERMDDFSCDLIISQLNALLILLMRQVAEPQERKLQTSNSVHSENEIIRQAQQFITEHIREKLSVPMVSRQVDVSPSYLTALFHKNLDISPGEYIRRIKLQESKQMIRENTYNFTQIAAILQYSTVHHFSRQFKEKFGITPTEYAKSVR